MQQFVPSLIARWIFVLGLIAAAALPSRGATTASAQNDRSHWSFIAPKLPALPAVRNKRWPRNPIDLFILARLEREGITPSPEADRRTLIRRLNLDLTGLPPTPEEARAFADDSSPEAYEHLVDSLLASPHFGERWARHWLDLARYADTSGYQIDRPRPFAWLYRDWVINAINDDLPFDQFTIEQLAGDLLPDATLAQKTAVGLHRMTLMNHEDGTDAEEFRCKAKVDRASTTGTLWLGLTIGCAECHNHKFDPVSQREFYQLYAFFNNADETDVPSPQAGDPVRFEREKQVWDTEQARLKAQLAQFNKTKDPKASEVKRTLARHRRNQPREAEARALSFTESTNAPRAYIHVRGDFLRRGEEVRPGTPAVLHPFQPRNASADRLDLARWLVAPENPLTPRVAANHIWQHLFSRGLVNTPDDFGLRGEPPSHPELLDWLAVTFSHGTASAHSPFAMGWSRKQLIRLIVTSATYRQASHHRPELQTRDPQNILLARQNRFRLESEIIRDLYLAVGGLLNDDLGGPSFRPHMSDDVKKLGGAGAFTWTDTEGPEKYRRGLYIFSQRTVPYPTAMTLDQADSSQPCTRRERNNTPLQALTLLNHGLFVECAQALGQRLDTTGGKTSAQTPVERIQRAFELALARPPTRQETARLQTLYRDALRTGGSTNDQPARLALSQVILNLDEFITRE